MTTDGAAPPQSGPDSAREQVLRHERLVKLLQLAYSAERAAAFAYVGHAGSVKDDAAKAAITQIELDEWGHRDEVKAILDAYGIAPSRFQEIRFWVIGKLIGISCYVIGWFMPYYFAGRLESGNVCEYFIMMRYFHELDITEHDPVLYEMGVKEKEHEMFFIDGIENKRLLPIFQRVFGWGRDASYNDVDLAVIDATESTQVYCLPSARPANGPKASWRLRRVNR